MGFLKGFRLGLLLGLIALAGCATTFSYKYYFLNGVTYSDGVLVGATAADDEPFMNCAPTSANAHPCTVMLTATFLQLKQDYLDMATQLATCQSGVAP